MKDTDLMQRLSQFTVLLPQPMYLVSISEQRVRVDYVADKERCSLSHFEVAP